MIGKAGKTDRISTLLPLNVFCDNLDYGAPARLAEVTATAEVYVRGEGKIIV